MPHLDKILGSYVCYISSAYKNIPFMLDECVAPTLLLRKERLFCKGETGFPSLLRVHTGIKLTDIINKKNIKASTKTNFQATCYSFFM